MSEDFVTSMMDAIRLELAKPDTIKAIVGIEDTVMKVALAAVDDVIPSLVRPFIVPLVNHFANEGITAVEHLTSEKLASMAPKTLSVQVGTATFALTVSTPKAQAPTRAEVESQSLQPDDMASRYVRTGHDGHEDDA